MQRTYSTSVYLAINGHECERDCDVTYDYQRASGDGWNEPREPESCAIQSVEVTDDKGRTVDLYPLLSAECVMGLAADCLEHEREAREPDPDLLRDLQRDEVPL